MAWSDDARDTVMCARSTRSSLLAGAIAFCLAAFNAGDVVLACTAFCAAGKGGVLVGNNEDYNNPRTKLWFVPARTGEFGRMYVGFDDLVPQGGMNERGLWFDGFAAPPQKVSSTLPHFQGNIVDRAMAECSTVEEVVRLFSGYNRNSLSEGVLMFADAAGDAVSIEANAMVRKSREHFVQTNFRLSQPESGAGDRRFRTANAMLEGAGGDVSVDLFRRILASTRQKGPFPTLYSNIYELRSRTMHLYYFHDFERRVTFQLDEELRKGAHVLDIPDLFPRNADAEAFAARRRAPDSGTQPRTWMAGMTGVALLLIVGGVAAIRGGRRVRLALAGLAAVPVAVAALVAIALNLHPHASPGWVGFSIGMSSGRSSHVGPNMLRTEGMSLTNAIATAYDVPTVRVVAPSWMGQARYTINAVGTSETPGSFRPMLQQELATRLQLAVHRETRRFDVFVLTATNAPRLQRVDGTNVRVWVHDSGMELEEAGLKNLAAALQGVLGKPVIDETGLEGNYELDLAWATDRVGSVTAALRDRYGLQLTPATRDMEALVVDSARRDAALVLLEHLGRLASTAPPEVRTRLARLLSVD